MPAFDIVNQAGGSDLAYPALALDDPSAAIAWPVPLRPMRPSSQHP